MLATGSFGALLTDGLLSVDIPEDNGAIGIATFNGEEYFNAGTPISNWGFQFGTDTSTFVMNEIDGTEGFPVNVSSGNTALGLLLPLGVSFPEFVQYSRAYDLLPGLNTLRVVINVTNNTLGQVDIALFDTFDPDQSDFATINDTVFDVYKLGISSASTGPNDGTVILGTADGRGVIDTGGFGIFGVDSGADLNTLISSPNDANGATADTNLTIGFSDTLAAGESAQFTYFLSFGGNVNQARANILAVVPEPGSLALFGLASLTLVMMRRTRRAKTL